LDAAGAETPRLRPSRKAFIKTVRLVRRSSASLIFAAVLRVLSMSFAKFFYFYFWHLAPLAEGEGRLQQK
jgi:hypothetical protein